MTAKQVNDPASRSLMKIVRVHERVPTLARDMLIATISVGSLPGDGEAARNFVRLARAFYEEVDAPTVPKSARDDDRMPADVLSED